MIPLDVVGTNDSDSDLEFHWQNDYDGLIRIADTLSQLEFQR